MNSVLGANINSKTANGENISSWAEEVKKKKTTNDMLSTIVVRNYFLHASTCPYFLPFNVQELSAF